MIKLPRWAQLIRPAEDQASKKSQDSANQEEIEEEEVYLRKRCFHILSQQMDQAMDMVYNDSLAPTVSTLMDFLDAAVPSPEQQPNRKRQRTTTAPTCPSGMSSSPCLDGLDTTIFDDQQEAHCPHDPLLLPLILLEGPFFGADRRAQVDSLAKTLRKHRGRSAVVQVQLSLQRRGQGVGMDDLVRQCQCLSPVFSERALYRRILKRKKKRACSFSDLLLLWAQNVSDYDDIVVFLNADESFYSAELHDFLHVLATRRSEQGLPISVVMLGPPEGRLQMELKSSLQGFAGLVIQSLALPSSEHLLNSFWTRLWIQMKFPIVFSPNLLEAIKRSCHQHRSCQRTLLKLQQILACRFVQKGSFMTVAHHSSVMNEVWPRMACFLADAEARQVLLGDDVAEVTSTQMLKALETIHSRAQTAHLSLQLMDRVRNNSKSSLQLFQPSFSNLFSKKSRRELLEDLLTLREQIDTSQTSDDGTPQTSHILLSKYVRCVSLETADQLGIEVERKHAADRRSFADELILLVGNCRDGDNLSEIELLCDEAFARWVSQDATPERALYQLARGSDASQNQLSDETTTIDSLASEPRRQIVTVLLQAPWESEGKGRARNRPKVIHIAGIMYCLIQDRVAVTQEDWVEEFWQRAIVERGAECSREDSFTLFSLGVRHLKQCGLIVEKLRMGSRSDIIYERAKLVWCAAN